MQAGGEIEGTVADSETDLPIEGVRVCARLLGFFQSGEVGYCGRRDAAGEFTVKNLGTGQYRLEFQTEGHVNVGNVIAPTTTLPQLKPTTRRPRCKKGSRRAMKRGHARCVKISKKHKLR